MLAKKILSVEKKYSATVAKAQKQADTILAKAQKEAEVIKTDAQSVVREEIRKLREQDEKKREQHAKAILEQAHEEVQSLPKRRAKDIVKVILNA